MCHSPIISQGDRGRSICADDMPTLRLPDVAGHKIGFVGTRFFASENKKMYCKIRNCDLLKLVVCCVAFPVLTQQLADSRQHLRDAIIIQAVELAFAVIVTPFADEFGGT